MTTLKSNPGTQSDINVTPLIDVLLVLLIIFMVITPLTPMGLPAALPQPAFPAHPEVSGPPIILELMRTGMLRLNTRELKRSEVRAQLEQAFSLRADKVLFIKADQTLEYREVAQIIDLIKGIDPSIQVGLITPRTS